MANLQSSSFFSFSNLNRNFLVVISIIFVLLLIENADSYVADFLVDLNTTYTGVTLFVVISIGFVVAQYFLLRFIRSSSETIKARSKLIGLLQNIVTIVQYILAANVVFLVAEILVLSTYPTISLVFVTYLSNLFTAALLGIFALRFISWYKSQSHGLGVLLYALAFLILAFSEVIAGLGDSYLLMQKDQIISPASQVEFYDFEEGSFFNVYFNYYDYIDYASFFLTLLASALLLYHYSKKANKPKIILIIFLPLLSYTSAILDALNIYDTDTSPDLFGYYIFQSLTRSLSGILFAISFLFVGMRLPESFIKTFLKVTAYGFILLYVTNHAGISVAPYPPFGINSLSLLPLATYFVLFGLYSSALSLSQDITLRNRLRSIARNDNNLLSSIGTAQMESEVNRAIGELKEVADEQEKELAEKSGIETPVPESEIEDYLKQVLEEVSKSRKK